MGISQFASRRTVSQFPAGTGAELTVANGEPVQVCGIHFSGTVDASTVFTVFEGDGTTVMFTVHLDALEAPYNMDTAFLADAGISVGSDTAAASCAVFHNSPGN
jgi:hypothetical protein